MTPSVVIVGGSRTPFTRSGSVFQDLSAIELGKLAVRDAVARSGVRAEEVDHLVYGTVVHDTQAPNIAREVGLAVLPKSVPAVTVSRACTSANQAITDAAQLIVAIANTGEVSGDPNMLEIHLSDSNETSCAYKVAVAKHNCSILMLLSR